MMDRIGSFDAHYPTQAEYQTALRNSRDARALLLRGALTALQNAFAKITASKPLITLSRKPGTHFGEQRQPCAQC
ncbi:MAG: hypothetical protein RIM33_09525 [Alphaproteobacteria bacterium]